jgi:hypothetical protein|tara:strand:+ start:790 stop:1059 length:270 start_codon:yes stop_codon:yes gene_type:complete
VLGWKKLTDFTSFGSTFAQKFNVGDLVCWSEWLVNANDSVNRSQKCGVLTNIIHKELGERQVTFAQILPFDDSKIIEMSILQIRKMETN